MDRKALRQIVRYGVVGVSGVGIDALLYTLLLHLGGSITASKMAGIITSVIYSYFCNTLWSFEAKPAWQAFIRFCLVYLMSIIANVTVNNCVATFAVGQKIALVAAFFCATTVSVAITFCGLRYWVYRP